MWTSNSADLHTFQESRLLLALALAGRSGILGICCGVLVTAMWRASCFVPLLLLPAVVTRNVLL